MNGEKVEIKDVKFSRIECRDGDNWIKKIDTENCLLRKIRQINLGNICSAIVISTFVNFLSLLETFIGMPLNHRGFFAYLRLIINIIIYFISICYETCTYKESRDIFDKIGSIVVISLLQFFGGVISLIYIFENTVEKILLVGFYINVIPSSIIAVIYLLINR